MVPSNRRRIAAGPEREHQCGRAHDRLVHQRDGVAREADRLAVLELGVDGQPDDELDALAGRPRRDLRHAPHLGALQEHLGVHRDGRGVVRLDVDVVAVDADARILGLRGRLIHEMRNMVRSNSLSPLRLLSLKITEAMLYNSSADLHEGFQAFHEKRDARFSGS